MRAECVQKMGTEMLKTGREKVTSRLEQPGEHLIGSLRAGPCYCDLTSSWAHAPESGNAIPHEMAGEEIEPRRNAETTIE